MEKHKLTLPQSWDDLLNPAFKGQLVIAHPASSGTAYTALITVLQLKGEAKGWEYWKQFHANVWQYTKSGAAPAQHVGQGEAAVGVVFSHDIVAQSEQGLPIVLSFAREGMGWEIGPWSQRRRNSAPNIPPIRPQPSRAPGLPGQSCCKSS